MCDLPGPPACGGRAQHCVALGEAPRRHAALPKAPRCPLQMEQMCDLLIERVSALEKEEGVLR